MHINEFGHMFCFTCASTVSPVLYQDDTYSTNSYPYSQYSQQNSQQNPVYSTCYDQDLEATYYYDTIYQVQTVLLSKGHSMTDILGYFIGIRRSDGSFINDTQHQIHNDYCHLVNTWR